MHNDSSGARLLNYDSRSLPRLSGPRHTFGNGFSSALNGLNIDGDLNGAAIASSSIPRYSAQQYSFSGSASLPTRSTHLPLFSSSNNPLLGEPGPSRDSSGSGIAGGSGAGPVPDPYNTPFPALQREYDLLRQEFDNLAQKFNTTMTSIKTFWSPELKKERAMRKDETAKLVLLQEQLKMSAQENQKQLALIRQLQDELHCQFELSRTARTSYDPQISQQQHQQQELPQLFSKEGLETIRTERDQLRRDFEKAKSASRELEMQVELQRQALSAREESFKKLMDVFQTGGSIPPAIVQERIEYEATRERVLELEKRCINLESLLSQKEQDVQFLQQECLNASNKFKEMQAQYDYCQRTMSDARDSGILQVLLKTKMAVIDQLEQRVALYEDEISRLREQNMLHINARNQTFLIRENNELKQKIEQMQLELSQRQLELLATNTRLSTAEEQSAELRKHLDLVKQSNLNKEQQIESLQNDIELLRSKLDNSRAESIESKSQQIIEQFQQENNMLLRKIDELKESLCNKGQSSSISAFERQPKRDFNEMNELDDNSRKEINEMRLAVETLQKEIIDRQVLIESQSEKISDVNKEFLALKLDKENCDRRLIEAVADVERLALELGDARSESERLLRIVQAMDKEKESINLQIKDLENKRIEDARQQEAAFLDNNIFEQSDVSDLKNLLVVKEQRIEELEEALKESVSITAEREMLIAQHKQVGQNLESKLKTYKEQMNKLQKQYDELNDKISTFQQDKQEKDAVIRALKYERRKNLEEVLQLKEEYLLAAISEKDAHIALLESTPSSNQDEIETLRKHKEKLMKRMKEENNRRVQLLTDQHLDGVDLTSNLVKALKSSPSDQEDEAEGIWA